MHMSRQRWKDLRVAAGGGLAVGQWRRRDVDLWRGESIGEAGDTAEGVAADVEGGATEEAVRHDGGRHDGGRHTCPVAVGVGDGRMSCGWERGWG